MEQFGIQDVDVDAAKRYLTKEEWPKSLQEMFIKGCQRYPVRFFVIDDSGSMARNDGHRRIKTGSVNKLVACSRWAEMTDSLRFHAGLAEAVSMPTEFRLLNGAPPVIIGRSSDDGVPYRSFLELLDRSPGGGTPLCRHMEEIVSQIQNMEAQLRANAQKAVIIIMTDGEPSDGDVHDIMKTLQDLPVWVVVRLCTDEEELTNYWNGLDGELEVEMDVLDDLLGEAREVHKKNKWLTYGEPLHRLREWGVQIKEMDLIDEDLLSTEQMRAVCALLHFDGQINALPHPDANWDGFFRAVDDATNSEALVWDPIKGKDFPWIRTEKLMKMYHTGGSSGKCVVM